MIIYFFTLFCIVLTFTEMHQNQQVTNRMMPILLILKFMNLYVLILFVDLLNWPQLSLFYISKPLFIWYTGVTNRNSSLKSFLLRFHKSCFRITSSIYRYKMRLLYLNIYIKSHLLDWKHGKPSWTIEILHASIQWSDAWIRIRFGFLWRCHCQLSKGNWHIFFHPKTLQRKGI